MRIFKTKNYDDMCSLAADYIRASVTLKPNALLGLATGSTPIGIYERLIDWNKKNEIDFSLITTINLDEYVGLEGTHEQSYRYFMNKHLFEHINIDINNTYVPNGMAKDLNEECKRYDKLIKSYECITLQLLGLGQNGHIGFNEPDEYFSFGTNVVNLTENTRKANQRFFSSIDEVPLKAITMGLDPILNAKTVVMVASGESKAQAVYDMVKGKITPNCPASILQYHKKFVLIVDEEAGKKI